MADRMKVFAWLMCAIIGSTTAIAQDEPDPYFIDANGDSIDGVLTDAIFVAPPPTGIDGATRGTTPADPVATIAFGISRAVTTGRSQVLVQIGTYNESISVVGGVSIYGGYDAAWARVASTATTSTVINGTTTTAVFANGITSPMTLSFLTIRSANASTPADSSYAVRIVNSSGPLTLRYNRVRPGAGGVGVNGANGVAAGAILTMPGPGQSPEETNSTNAKQGGLGGTSACSATGGKGGNGGVHNGLLAQIGGSGSGGATGGPIGANSDTTVADGGNGGAGGNGADGNGGTQGAVAASTIGSIDGNSFYLPPVPSNAENGTHAASGAGGGGGGGQDCQFCVKDLGGSGGGGGAGGCGGGGAGGGRGGGGSFGVVVDLLSNAVITSNYFAPSVAGPGGNGGDGAPGSLGSPGANGGPKIASSDGGSGGKGGDGGDGGDGGSGAGGHGGPAIAILDPVDRITGIGNRYLQAPSAALPGANGNGNSATPAPGVRQFKHPSNVATLATPAASINDIIAPEPGSGSFNALFTVTLDFVSDSIITINYTLNGTGGATPGSDFNATSGTVTFNPWTTTATIAVPILADAEVEAAEQFQLVLTAPMGISNFTLGDGIGIGTIVTDGIFQNSFE